MKLAKSVAAAQAASSIARLRRAWYMATMALDQSSNCGAMSCGTPSRRQIVARRDPAAIGVEQVEAAGGKGVDQVMGPALRSPGASAAIRREVKARKNQAAQAGMAGRLQFQHGMGLDIVERA